MSDPDCEGYGSTKAGLLGLTQSMAVSCQRWGIRVNAISPGWVHVVHECREGDEAATMRSCGSDGGRWANGGVRHQTGEEVDDLGLGFGGSGEDDEQHFFIFWKIDIRVLGYFECL